METSQKKAVCLLSGGLDSATAAFLAIDSGFKISALTIDYGQLHQREVESAKRISERLGIRHTISRCAMPWGGSALLDQTMPIPINREEKEMCADIPLSYVPARNSVFLSLAVSCAEAQGAQAVFIGANAVDYSGYPDCRPAYFHAMTKALRLGTKCGIQNQPISIETPLIHLKKSEIIRRGISLGVPYELTWSCYRGGELPCRICDACRLREKGFREAGLNDPLSAFATETGHSASPLKPT